LIFPIVPGIAASTPIVDGGLTGRLDTRLDVYRHSADRIRSIAGRIIPEQVFSRTHYEGRVLRQLYDDIAPHDPTGILKHEWLNSRGCIARFDRNTIEVRLLDLQECPRADLAIISALTGVIRALVDGQMGDLERQKTFHEDPLADLLLDGIGLAENAIISDPDYLDVLGFPERSATTSGDLWRYLVESVSAQDPEYGKWRDPITVILDHGTLASRIVSAVGPSPPRERLREVYGELCDSLACNQMFGP